MRKSVIQNENFYTINMVENDMEADISLVVDSFGASIEDLHRDITDALYLIYQNVNHPSSETTKFEMSLNTDSETLNLHIYELDDDFYAITDKLIFNYGILARAVEERRK